MMQSRRIFPIIMTGLLLCFAGAHAHAQSSLADQQFVFAYRLLQRGETQPAIDAFADFVVRFPNDERLGDANYFQALLTRKANLNEQALPYLSPTPKTKLVPAHAVMLLRGQILVELGQFDRAIADLEKIDPQSLSPAIQASTFSLRGMAYRGTNNLVAAAEAFTQAAAIDSPMRARALLDLGRTETALKKNQQAVAHLDQAINLATHKPASSAGQSIIPAAALLAGDLAMQQRQPDKAMTYYQQVITGFASSPQFPAAAMGAMWAARSANQPKRVVQLHELFAAQLPRDRQVETTYLVGAAHTALGHHEKALAVLQPQQNATGPMHDQLLYQLALVQQQNQQLLAMRTTLQQLVEQYPASTLRDDARFLLATADEKTDPVRAIAQLTELIDQTPAHPYRVAMLYRRARLFVAQNKSQAAADDFAAVLDQTSDPKTSPLPASLRHDSGQQLMNLLLRLGDATRADAVARTLLNEPNLPVLVEQETMFRLALAQIRQDKPADAAATLDQLAKKHPANRHSADAAYYRALLAIRLDEPDAANALRQSASAPNLSDAMRLNALRVASVRFQERGDNRDAASTLDELVRRVGMDQLTHDERLWLAQYKLDQQQPDAALSLASPLLTDHPSALQPDAQTLYIVGSSEALIGNTDQAIEHLRHAIALDQGFATLAQQQLARALRDAKRDDEALAEYASLASNRQAAVAATALFDAALLHRQRAAHHLQQGDRPAVKRELSEAQGLLKRLIVLYPQTPESYESAIELAEIEDAGDAENVLRELVEKTANLAAANNVNHANNQSPQNTKPEGENVGGGNVGGNVGGDVGGWGDFAKALLALRANQRNDALFLLHKLRDDPNVPDALARRVLAQLKKIEGGS